MGDAALVRLHHPRQSFAALAQAEDAQADRQLRTGCHHDMANRAGYPGQQVQPPHPEDAWLVALPDAHLHGSARAAIRPGLGPSAPSQRGKHMTQSPVRLEVQEAYERWASEYDARPNALLALEERCLAPRMMAFAGKDIVEFGCGTGRWLKKLEKSGSRSLTGVDFSISMLAAAK